MLTTSYPPAAGVPNGAFVHRLAARLVAAGHQVDVLAPHAEGAHSRVEDGVRSHFFRYAPSRLELLAYGPGMVYNLSVDRRRLALLPSFGAAFALAAARHAGRAWRRCRVGPGTRRRPAARRGCRRSAPASRARGACPR